MEAARIEAEEEKNIFQYSQTAPTPPLKKSLEKAKQPQLQGYTQKSRDGNQTPTKDRSQQQTQKEHLSPNSHSIGKSRAEGSKMAERTKRPSDNITDDNPSPEESDAGRDPDRSGSDNEPQTAAEESDRSVREITPSMAEWEKITGQKQRCTSSKTNKPNKLPKIRDAEYCDGNAEK